MAYSEKVIDHYEKPRNIGSMDKRIQCRYWACGCSRVWGCYETYRYSGDDDKIIDAKFKTFGCGSAIAASSLATEWIKDKSIDEAMGLDNTQIVEELSLPPVKIHCSVLAEDAIKASD